MKKITSCLDQGTLLWVQIPILPTPKAYCYSTIYNNTKLQSLIFEKFDDDYTVFNFPRKDV